jgi:hypothetical protein
MTVHRILMLMRPPFDLPSGLVDPPHHDGSPDPDSHPVADARPESRKSTADDLPPGQPRQRREHLRFDTLVPVRVESLLFGDLTCVARNISTGGLFLEVSEPLPLGTTVRVCFPVPDGSGEVVALGEVKNHYFINYVQAGEAKAVSGMAVRFTSFEKDSHHVLQDCMGRLRVLH